MKILISRKDLHRETFKGSGKGGQHRNKVETAVRYTHKPTGIKAESCDERHQSQNDEIALERLIEKLHKKYTDELRNKAKTAYNNKCDVAFGHQIRTYYLCGHKRVIDHRTGKEYDVDKVLDGELPNY